MLSTSSPTFAGLTTTGLVNVASAGIGAQLLLQNTNQNNIFQFAVGDAGYLPWTMYIGSLYGTNNIADFAYGIQIGAYGNSSWLLRGVWGQGQKFLFDPSGNLWLAGGATIAGTVTCAGSGNTAPIVTDQTANRVSGTNYQNTTGKTLCVSVLFQGAASGALGGEGFIGASTSSLLEVDRIQIAVNAISGQAHTATIRLTVPPNWYYQVAIGGGGYINVWYEGNLI